jgi:hypothetical protein
VIIALPPDVEVLADAIEQQAGERPDELCPVFLAQIGRELGGNASLVGQSLWRGPPLQEALEVYENIRPDELWADLVQRRTYREGPTFTGLLLAEVWSAVAWQLESLRQLQGVGFTDVESEDWEICRTIYKTRRHEVFQVRADGRCCWRTEESHEIRGLKVPLRSKIRQDLVRAPRPGILDARLKAWGWRSTGSNLLRDRSWAEHSRKKRTEALAEAEVLAQRAALPRAPHRWQAGETTEVERCARCDLARVLAAGRVSVYRYARGTPAEVGEARAWSRVLREMPRCKTKEGA